MATEALATPALADSEVAQALRAQVLRGHIDGAAGRLLLDRWVNLGVRRHFVQGLLPRIWELRDNVSAYDATYVALAEALGCDLVTGDAHLGTATGPRCGVVVVPR